MSEKLSKRISEFTDISLAFQANPVTGDITTLKNDRAIRNALKNCVMIAAKEKAFNPTYGSVIGNSLFEMDDAFSLGEIEIEVTRTIEYNEPRVQVISVKADRAGDSQTSSKITMNRSKDKTYYSNTIAVSVTYEIVGYQEVFNTEFILTPSSTL